MNLVQLSHNQTMTLKEITDMLDVRHNDAMNVVERMVENPEFGTATKISYLLPKGNGASQSIQTYRLDKRQSIAVASKLNTALLMRIIDRWTELEEKNSKLLPQTHIQAVEAYLETLKQLEAQQIELGLAQEIIKEEVILTEKSDEYLTVKQLRELGVSKPSGITLNRVSAAMGYEVKKVFSQYDGIASNSYSTVVINAVYGTNF